MINIFPRKTEKAYTKSQNNVYVFDVDMNANRKQIAEAVEASYGVKVNSITTLVQKGKAVRYSRGKRAYPGSTVRKDIKKAYVTLAKGDSIKVFEEVESQDEKVKTDKKEKK